MKWLDFIIMFWLDFLKGSSTRDTLSAWCCPVCASCQIANELDERKPTVPDEFSHEVFKYWNMYLHNYLLLINSEGGTDFI